MAVLLTNCVVSNPKFFSKVNPTEDPSYGYTKENPVTIKNADLGTSIGSSYYYISRLRTEKGNKLKLLMRFSVKNPNYEKPKIQLQNRFTGEYLNYGRGSLLDLYILKPQHENDTIKLYVNPYLKGVIRVPVGSKFEKE